MMRLFRERNDSTFEDAFAVATCRLANDLFTGVYDLDSCREHLASTSFEDY